jgi:hypothetical protein
VLNTKSPFVRGLPPDLFAELSFRDDNNNGGYNSGFVGKMGEIIAFSKSLNTEERQEVEKYLGKKWGIAVR